MGIDPSNNSFVFFSKPSGWKERISNKLVHFLPGKVTVCTYNAEEKTTDLSVFKDKSRFQRFGKMALHVITCGMLALATYATNQWAKRHLKHLQSKEDKESLGPSTSKADSLSKESITSSASTESTSKTEDNPALAQLNLKLSQLKGEIAKVLEAVKVIQKKPPEGESKDVINKYNLAKKYLRNVLEKSPLENMKESKMEDDYMCFCNDVKWMNVHQKLDPKLEIDGKKYDSLISYLDDLLGKMNINKACLQPAITYFILHQVIDQEKLKEGVLSLTKEGKELMKTGQRQILAKNRDEWFYFNLNNKNCYVGRGAYTTQLEDVRTLLTHLGF